MDFASAIEDCLLQADKDFDKLCSQLTQQQFANYVTPPVKTGRFDNTFRNLIISNLIGQFNLVMVEYIYRLYTVFAVHMCVYNPEEAI